MKLSILIFALVMIIHASVFAQSNQIAIQYSLADSEYLSGKDVVGGGGYDNSNFKHVGLLYYRQINEKWRLKSGFELTDLNVKISSAPTPEVFIRTEEQTIYTIPIGANFSISNWFSLEGGFTLDIPKADYSPDSQLGLGYEIGSKFHYKPGDWGISAYPNFSKRGFIPFEKDNFYYRLTELGIQFSVGYSF